MTRTLTLIGAIMLLLTGCELNVSEDISSTRMMGVSAALRTCSDAEQAAVMRDYELCAKTDYQRAYCLDRAIVMNCSMRPGL